MSPLKSFLPGKKGSVPTKPPAYRWCLMLCDVMAFHTHESGKDFSCCPMSSKRCLLWSPWPLCKSSTKFLNGRLVGKTKRNLVDDASGHDCPFAISRCHAA